MAVGQIVYNLYNFGEAEHPITTEGIDIMNNKNLLANFGNAVKLGIQCEPGERWTIETSSGNEPKEIMVGRSGVYELDNDIIVSLLKYNPRKGYILNEEKTNEAINKGLLGLNAAEDERTRSLKEFGIDMSDTNNLTQDQVNEYNNIQNKFQQAYKIAYATYIRGVNGIYEESEENIKPKNIIIDFVYNSSSEGGNQ